MKKFNVYVAMFLALLVIPVTFAQALVADMPRFSAASRNFAPAMMPGKMLQNETSVSVDQTVEQEAQPEFDPLQAVAEPMVKVVDDQQTQQDQAEELKRLQLRIEEIKQQQAAKAQQAQNQIQETVQVKVGDIPILPPLPGYQPRLSDGEIMVAAQAIFQTAFASQVVGGLKRAKTRAEQEDVVLEYASPDLKSAFELSHKDNPEGLMNPDDFAPMNDEKEAMNLAVIKQPFVDFPGWGENPFGSPAKSWQDLRDHFSDYMMAVIERTSYPPEMKAEWFDTLKATLSAGPDGKYSKVVNLQDWSKWQWTAGRIPGTFAAGRIHGVNIRYTNGPAYGLAIFLRKYGLWVIHGFPCRGNPIIPFQGTTKFSVTRTEETPKPPTPPTPPPPPPIAVCLSADVKVMGDIGHITVDFKNPDQLSLEFVYFIDGREVHRSNINTYDFPIQNYRDGVHHTVEVKGFWNGGDFSCPAGLSSGFLVPLPPPPKVPCKCERVKTGQHKFNQRETEQIITLTPKITGDGMVSAVWTDQNGTVINSKFVNNQLQLSGRAGALLPTVTKKGKTQLVKGDYTFTLTVTSLDGNVSICKVTVSVTGAKIWPWLLLAAIVIAVVVIIVLSHGAAAAAASKIAIAVKGVLFPITMF